LRLTDAETTLFHNTAAAALGSGAAGAEPAALK